MDDIARQVGYLVIAFTSLTIFFFMLMAVFFWVANRTVFKSRQNRVTAGRM